MLVVACLMCFIHSCLSYLMATCLLSCYDLLIIMCLVKHPNFDSHV
jgi:hypothetical protein